jgi:tRNA-dihydrouridine synthase B|tara:strand:+ start:640 stop:1623 length:984 start_codon:yes stop_codon:yes gene_type:complete
MKIGNIKISTPVFLAPMAGYTDYPFRILCKRNGAGLVYSEFVSADGIIRENIRTLEMIHFEEEERPVGIQIFGSDPKIMNQATEYIIKMFKPDLIDINYGCPVPKVTNKGGGSAALKDLCLMDDITDAVVEAAQKTPVTVKMRAGWDINSIIINEAGPRLEESGIKAITLHPRTTKQKYNGKANWDLIKNLKKSVSIPVIGNGDVKNIDDIKKMFEYTGCDAVMIARAAQGNPWIFDKAKKLFDKNHQSKKISLKSISSMCKDHFTLLTKEKGCSTGMNLMRKHFSNYLKGFPNASIFRQKLVTANSYEKMILELEKFDKYANEESL